MKLRDNLIGQLDEMPDDLVTASLAELERLGVLDKEMLDITVREIRAVASVFNVPAEVIAVHLVEQRCRVCGCTNEDCSGCMERTGQPCYWVAYDLCSACQSAVKPAARPRIIVPLLAFFLSLVLSCSPAEDIRPAPPTYCWKCAGSILQQRECSSMGVVIVDFIQCHLSEQEAKAIGQGKHRIDHDASGCNFDSVWIECEQLDHDQP